MAAEFGARRLDAVAGVPETVLSGALLASLPRTAPPAPWTVECNAVIWATRARRAGADVLPPLLRDWPATAVVGGVVRYSATPVGPYAEVLGALGGLRGLRPWGSVPFMAVDSAAGLAAGRLNWGLPKTLGVLDGSPGTGTVAASRAESADGLHWRVSATPRAFGPAVPVRGRATLRQVSDGVLLTSEVTAAGRLRLALVRVGVESDGPLSRWLRPGRHAGAVLSRVRMTIGVPEAAAVQPNREGGEPRLSRRGSPCRAGSPRAPR